MTDQTITCQNCSSIFVFSQEEQQLYQQRNLLPPQLCPICRGIQEQAQKIPPKPIPTPQKSPSSTPLSPEPDHKK